MKLLIVEDNVQLSSNIKSYLSEEGYVCEISDTYQKAIDKLYAFKYDIIALDLMLPDGEGLDLLRIVKERFPDIGVLIISAKNALDDKLEGLNLGADDYLAKPFHLSELHARLRAIYRRRNQEGNDLIVYKEISIDVNTFEIKVNKNLLDLTRKEFELIHYLVINKNRLLTKQSIAEHLWGDYMDSADSFDFVYQHIKNIRKKINQAGGNDYIQTVYGVGYKFKSEE